MFNKNMKKKLFTGLAAVALFAPMALSNGQAHASDLDNAFSKTNTEKAVQQGAEQDKEDGQWAKAHANDFGSPDDWKAGDQGEPVPSNNTTNNTSSSNSSSNNNPSDDGEGSYTPVTNSNPDQNDAHNSHSTSQNTTKQNNNLTYPKTPKNEQKTNDHNGDDKIARQLRHYEKDVSNKHARKELAMVTKHSTDLSNHRNKKELQRVTKHVHGAKNRHAYQNDVKKL